MGKFSALKSTIRRTKTEIHKEKKKQKRQYQLKSSTGKVWDRELTAKYNYARLDLVADPNKPSEENHQVAETLPKEKKPEILDEIISKKPQFKSRLCFIVHESERKTLQALIDKHGENYTAMAWDTDVNILQWTPIQCEKRVKKYKIYMEQLEYEAKTKTGVKGPVQPKKNYKHPINEGDRYQYHKETDVFF
ncbi:predicted protein [Naegleria gruberi]|uniref:Nucleolar protein 16 n=1 Tax=Naegleria gruberi TaxID=5762 RepID=D2UY72_NAEGR|nr:uncharacterized protein NAEGRDRAFT_45108 [Naegleria gruberi]EFC50744.1 predicted protein [Naegleria gruberi]|eukprot:XP_002683488.1 predicted protein [Naegleria gruberi strain NEG-M]